MKNIRLILMGVVMLGAVNGWGQEMLKPDNIPTLNRIAGEYDFWKWVFTIATSGLAIITLIWSVFGMKTLLKSKVNDWLDNEIAKKAGLRVEDIRSALLESALNAKLKQKKVWVISAAGGQQTNVKKVFDGCGFTYDERIWVDVQNLESLVLGNVDVLLFNDQVDLPLTEEQIELTIKKFRTNVGYFYFGDKIIDSKKYRKEYKIDIDFCNSATRLETGLLSLLKIR